jgi:Flp pilus assembly protein TadD
MDGSPASLTRSNRIWPRLTVLTALLVVGVLLTVLVVAVARWWREDPADAGARLLAHGDYSTAIPFLLRAVAVRGADPWPHYELGLAYARIGWPQAASKQFTTATQLAPWSADFRAALGCAFRDAGELTTAVNEMEQASGLAPEEPRHHVRLAELLLLVGRRSEAVGQLREAARLRPASSELQALLAQASGVAGESEKVAREAEEDWPRAAETALHALDQEELRSEADACAPRGR